MSAILQCTTPAQAGPVRAKPAPPAAGSSLLPEGPKAMNGEPLQQTFVITNPQGFHMRPLTQFAELAGRYQCKVTVGKENQRVNGKSPLDLMLLAAEQGTVLTLEVEGIDAASAFPALVDLMRILAAGDPPEPPLPQKG